VARSHSASSLPVSRPLSAPHVKAPSLAADPAVQEREEREPQRGDVVAALRGADGEPLAGIVGHPGDAAWAEGNPVADEASESARVSREPVATRSHGSGVGSGIESRGEGKAAEGGAEQDRRQKLSLAAPDARQGRPEAEYGHYLALLRQEIHQSLSYPPAARRRGVSGTVHMEIVIQPTGVIGSVLLLSSSSHPILDAAALDAVRRLPPLPFPAELPPRPLHVRLPVVFELR